MIFLFHLCIGKLKQQHLFIIKIIFMEELIKMVTSKAGISESQAKSAIETVVSFLKNKLPAGLGSQVESSYSWQRLRRKCSR
jgi:hypothetical protein